MFADTTYWYPNNTEEIQSSDKLIGHIWSIRDDNSPFNKIGG